MELFFKFGSLEEIKSYCTLNNVDLDKFVKEMNLLSYLSQNPLYENVMEWIVEDQKIDIGNRDEQGRNWLDFACE